MQMQCARWVFRSLLSVAVLGNVCTIAAVNRDIFAKRRRSNTCSSLTLSRAEEGVELPVTPSTPPPRIFSESFYLATELRKAAWSNNCEHVFAVLDRLYGCDRLPDELVTPLECVFRRSSPVFADQMCCLLSRSNNNWAADVSITRLRGVDHDSETLLRGVNLDSGWDSNEDGFACAGNDECWLDPEERLLRVLARECCALIPGRTEWQCYSEIEANHRKVIAMLLDAGAQLDPKRDAALLKMAALIGDEQSVDQLLKRGVSIGNGDFVCQTPLYMAVIRGHEGIVSRLLDAGASVDPAIIPHMLSECHKSCSVSIMEMLLAKLDESKKGAGLYDVVNMPGENRNTPLHLAALGAGVDVVRLLCARGANMCATNAVGDTPLHLAAYGCPDVVKFLLEQGADCNACALPRCCAPLHRAASGGSVECARLLLRAGADLNAQDEDGQTPLHYAAQNGNSDVERILLAGGAFVERQDDGGDTPLHRAIACDNREIVRVFLDHNSACVNMRGCDDKTPLHVASRGGYSYSIRSLLEHGADPNACDAHGRTPLHEAAKRGKVKNVCMLLAAGADINAVDKDGATPLALAAAEGYVSMVEFLIDQGGDIEDEKCREVMLSQIVCRGKLPSYIIRALLAAGMRIAY